MTWGNPSQEPFPIIVFLLNNFHTCTACAHYSRGSKISPEGCRELGHMLAGNSSLQTLDCTDCGITDEGAIELGRTLYLNTSLRHLNLGFNRIGHIAVAIISQSLRMGTLLKSLDFSNNPLGNKGAEILAQSIVDAMDRKTEPWQLRVLHMNNCGIGDSGASALAAALKRCDSIEKMYLNFNPISIDGAIELAVAAGPQVGEL
jgi:Ran GTPase-activating protein (RanGAP) involved in mRNA processing and transport